MKHRIQFLRRRREFITLLGGAAAWRVMAWAQQAKLPTIGFLGSGTAATQSQWTGAFVQRLRELGWSEGRDVAIEYRNNQQLEDLARLMNPVVRGWMNYYGRFYRSKCVQVLRHINEALARWARRKYKRFKRRERASMHWLGSIARRDPNLFVLWQLGVRPEAGG